MHDDDTIDLIAYLKRLTRFLLPAAVIGLVVMVAVSALGLIQKNEVHTKAHVLVQPAQPDNKEQATIEAELLSRTMRTYVALADLPQLAEEAAGRTNGKFTPEQVIEQTEIFWGGGSLLLAIKASAATEEDAELLSNAMADALVKLGPGLLKKQKETVPIMTVIERAKLDDDPSLPKPVSRFSRVPQGLMGGLVAAGLTAVVLEWLASRRARVDGAAPAAVVAGAGPDPARDDLRA